MDFFDFTLSMARSERALRVAEAHERPGKYAQHELVDATRAWRHHPSNVLVGDEGAVEDRIVTAGSAHAQGAPRLGDGVTLRGTQQKCVHDFRRGRITCVHAMDAEECPDWRETAEELVAIKTVTPVHALGARGRQQHWEVVARLRRDRRRKPGNSRRRGGAIRASGHRTSRGPRRRPSSRCAC